MKTPIGRNFFNVGFSLLLGLPQVVAATCTVGISQPSMDLGTSVYNAGSDSDVPGYRRVGNSRTGVLNVSCDADRKTFQLGFSNIAGLNQKLLKWDTSRGSGAMRLRVTKATADAVPVNLIAGDGTPVAALDVVRDGEVLTLDLTALPKGARTFMLEVQVTGMIDRNFVPISRTDFTMTPRVQLLNP